MNATRKKNNHINTKSPQTLHYKENNQPKAYHNFGKQKQTNNNTQATKTRTQSKNIYNNSGKQNQKYPTRATNHPKTIQNNIFRRKKNINTAQPTNKHSKISKQEENRPKKRSHALDNEAQ